MRPGEISVGLAAWIIQDGNYGEFRVGQKTRFALEFFPRRLGNARGSEPFLTPVGPGLYRGRGRVVHITKNAWVIDWGILAYHLQPPPAGARTGGWLEGEFGLGIDPFFYFESLRKEPGMPASAYDVEVREILLETTPRKERKEGRRTVLERVRGQTSYRSVRHTDAWKDDGGNAHYVLRCGVLGGPHLPSGRIRHAK